MFHQFFLSFRSLFTDGILNSTNPPFPVANSHLIAFLWAVGWIPSNAMDRYVDRHSSVTEWSIGNFSHESDSIMRHDVFRLSVESSSWNKYVNRGFLVPPSRCARTRRLATILTSPLLPGCSLLPLSLPLATTLRRSVPRRRRTPLLRSTRDIKAGPPWIIQRARSCRFANADTRARGCVSRNFEEVSRPNYADGMLGNGTNYLLDAR